MVGVDINDCVGVFIDGMRQLVAADRPPTLLRVKAPDRDR